MGTFTTAAADALSGGRAELTLEVLRGADLWAAAALGAASAACHRAVAGILPELRTAFPEVAFVCRRGAFGRNDLGGGGGGGGSDDGDDDSDDDDDESLNGDEPRGASAGGGNLLAAHGDEACWRELAAAVRDLSWVPAGLLRGQVHVCSAWRSEGLPLPPHLRGLGGAEGGDPEERERPVWRQRQRRVWSGSKPPATAAAKSQQELPAGFALSLLRAPTSAGVAGPRLPAFTVPRTRACIGVVGGELIACGGCVPNDNASTATEVYDPETDSWKPVPPPPVDVECRVWAAAGTSAMQLYVPQPHAARATGGLPALMSRALAASRAGSAVAAAAAAAATASGEDGGAAALVPLVVEDYSPWWNFDMVASVERFDTLSGVWRRAAPMGAARADAAAATVGGKLYVCGGFDEAGKALRSAERWDPVADRWEQLPLMLEARSFASARALGGGRLLVCGGFGADRRPRRTAEVFDPRTRSWSFLPDPFPPDNLVAESAGNL